jgi:hypothetical protein
MVLQEVSHKYNCLNFSKKDPFQVLKTRINTGKDTAEVYNFLISSLVKTLATDSPGYVAHSFTPMRKNVIGLYYFKEPVEYCATQRIIFEDSANLKKYDQEVLSHTLLPFTSKVKSLFEILRQIEQASYQDLREVPKIPPAINITMPYMNFSFFQGSRPVFRFAFNHRNDKYELIKRLV